VDYSTLLLSSTYCHVWGVCVTNNNGFWLDDWIYWHFYYNYNQFKQLIINDCLRLAQLLPGLRVSSLLRDWFGSDLRVGHFFSFRCPLVNTPQLNTELSYDWLMTELNYDWTTTAPFWVWVWVWVSCADRRLVGLSCLGLTTKFLLLSDSCEFVDLGRPLWREDGSVVYNSCWLRQRSHFRVRVP
jgi:hypothetical protein